MSITTRFNDLVQNIDRYTFHILGTGAIGSTLAEDLARMGAVSLVLYDMDTVSEENVGVSVYTLPDIGKKKIIALQDILLSINPSMNITLNIKKITSNTFLNFQPNDFVLLCFDNMRIRKIVASKACTMKATFLIDGRMGAEQFQMYTFKDPVIKDYLKHWYTDKSADPEPCTAKATTYCRSLASSLMINSIKRMLMNQNTPNTLVFDFNKLYMGRS